MKIKIEIEPDLLEDEVIIRCGSMSEDINRLYQTITDASFSAPKVAFYKNNDAYFFPLSHVLFFETEGDYVYAHTEKDVYRVKMRLYELEEALPKEFIRSSKSAILNIEHIFSINRSVSSSSLVQFKNSRKQVYVSRFYYKGLKQRLEERRKS